MYHRLPASDANNYEVVKEALLIKLSLTSGDNRKNFFACKQNANENASQFFSRLEHIISQWILLSKIDHSFEAFRDLILGEQFLQACSRELSLFIRERTPTGITEMMKLASIFSESRTPPGSKRQSRSFKPRR